ncbi:MAG: branched-chain amino acid ABC transporter substrate-binding protein [Devosiaceae bacterium]|nr:branched-chain amino acid ABC transporter substrate-binding protein [Devosiaceae bacterium MH13]
MTGAVTNAGQSVAVWRVVRSLLTGRRLVLRALAVVALLPFAAGSGALAQGTAGETIRLGVLAPLSGPFEALGTEIVAGVQRAATASGQSIEITAVDHVCDEDAGRDGANQLIGAQVDAVIAGVCWRPVAAARDVLAFEGVPLFVAGVRYGPLTDGAAPGTIFRVAGRDDQQGAYIAEFLLAGALDFEAGRSVTSSNIALLHTDGSYGRTLADSVADALEEGGVSLALREPFDPVDGLQRAAVRARAEDPGLVMVFAGQADTALLVSALRAEGYAGLILTGDSALTGEFPLLADGAADGVVFPRPTVWRFELSPPALSQWLQPDEATRVLLPAVAATQVALARLAGQTEEPYDSVLGPLTFTPNGDVQLPGFGMWTWQGGLIWPLGTVPEELRTPVR